MIQEQLKDCLKFFMRILFSCIQYVYPCIWKTGRWVVFHAHDWAGAFHLAIGTPISPSLALANLHNIWDIDHGDRTNNRIARKQDGMLIFQQILWFSNRDTSCMCMEELRSSLHIFENGLCLGAAGWLSQLSGWASDSWLWIRLWSWSTWARPTVGLGTESACPLPFGFPSMYSLCLP